MRVAVLTTSYPRYAGDVAGLFVADQVEHIVAGEQWHGVPAALEDRLRRLVTAHDVHRCTHPRFLRESLGRFLIDLERQLGVHIPAVIAGTVRQLGVAALRAADVVDRLEGVMGPALALARLGMFLDGKHRFNSCDTGNLRERGRGKV